MDFVADADVNVQAGAVFVLSSFSSAWLSLSLFILSLIVQAPFSSQKMDSAWNLAGGFIIFKKILQQLFLNRNFYPHRGYRIDKPLIII